MTDMCSPREQGKIKWEEAQAVDGSPLAGVFMGQLKSSLQCTVCKNTSLTFEPFWDVGLPIPKVGVCVRTNVHTYVLLFNYH